MAELFHPVYGLLESSFGIQPVGPELVHLEHAIQVRCLGSRRPVSLHMHPNKESEMGKRKSDIDLVALPLGLEILRVFYQLQKPVLSK